MRVILTLFISAYSVIAVGKPVQAGHIGNGTDYGEQGVKAYAESCHGPDGAVLLDPFFLPFLENLEGKTVLDAGCGAGPWSVYAASHGGKVYGIDIQENMIKEAKQTAQKADLVAKVNLQVGDVAALPYENRFFDRAVSLVVGCNLPPDAFASHVRELSRTLKDGGEAILAAPISLDTVFTNATSDTQLALEHIEKVLASLDDDPGHSVIYQALMQLDEVTSATFAKNDSRLFLVTDSTKQLEEGQEIWRKLPSVIVPNHFHSEEDYFRAFNAENFSITKIERPHFANKEELLAYNSDAKPQAKLGEAYIDHAPFALYHLQKNAHPTDIILVKNQPRKDEFAVDVHHSIWERTALFFEHLFRGHGNKPTAITVSEK